MPEAPPPPVPAGLAASSSGLIDLNPQALWHLGAKALPGEVDQLVDALNRVNQAVAQIKLSWWADSANSASDFHGRWAACSDALFGPPKAPEQGVLSRIVNGVRASAVNMGAAEAAVVKSWQDYATSLVMALGGGAGSPPPPDQAVDPPIIEV